MSFFNFGTIGPTGPRGYHGLQGDIGPTGPRGYVGSQGDTGPTGPGGMVGRGGEVGPTRPRGLQGPRGKTGFPGPTGPRGLQGFTGPRGEIGPVGLRGPTGYSNVTFKLDYGAVSVPTMTSNSTVIVTVNFKNTFTSLPSVIVTPVFTSDSVFVCSIVKIYNEKCDIRIYSELGGAVDVNWIAVASVL